MKTTLDLAVFAPGTYPSMDGELVTFTPAMLREMDQNTRYLIDIGVLTPPIKYDHPVWGDRSKDAHGHAVKTEVRGDVFYSINAQPSKRLIDDVDDGRRLRGSGEFFKTYKWVDSAGKPRELGPVYVGFAALGAERQALRNPNVPPLKEAVKNMRRVPVNELTFGESVSEVAAHYIRHELQSAGVVAQTFNAEGHYCFSEIAFDASVFAEENTTMTDAEIQALVTNTVNSATAPLKVENEALKTKLAAQETSFNERIQSFSESSVRKGDVKNFCEAVQKPNGKPNPRLTGPNVARLEKILLNPSVVKDKELDSDIRAFVEGIPPILVERGNPAEGDPAGNGSDKEEPKALADVRPKHFSDIRKFGEQITASVAAYFSEHPEQLKGIENNPAAQVAVVSDYVTKRDLTARS